jgi:hypothetical protein
MKTKIELHGDRRLTENVILEIQAAARRLGLEIENIELVRPPAGGRKARKPASSTKPASRRKPGSRA